MFAVTNELAPAPIILNPTISPFSVINIDPLIIDSAGIDVFICLISDVGCVVEERSAVVIVPVEDSNPVMIPVETKLLFCPPKTITDCASLTF